MKYDHHKYTRSSACDRCGTRRRIHRRYRWLYSVPPYGVWTQERPKCDAVKSRGAK